MAEDDLKKVVGNILKDIRVELSDEFDRNFERQAFFSQAWQRRKSPSRNGRGVLIDTGNLRRSIKSEVKADGITFFSSEPYAAIHNEGGEIRVTAKMKRYFWHKYMTAAGALTFSRRKDGNLRRDKNTLRINGEAEFWKHMALMKVGKIIKIPRRQFLGYSPEVEKLVREIIEENLTEYFNQDFKL